MTRIQLLAALYVGVPLALWVVHLIYEAYQERRRRKATERNLINALNKLRSGE